MFKKIILVTLTSIVGIHALISLFRIITSFAPDFSVFYDAARGLTTGQNVYTMSMYTGLGYPPFTLIPFLPFLLLPYSVAQGMWIVLSFACLFAAIYVSLVIFKKKITVWFMCAAFICSFLAFPTKFTLGMGQVNLLALALLLFSIMGIQQKKIIWSGIALGLLLTVKPHFLLFVPLYILTSGWVVPTIALGALGLGILLTGVLFGWNAYLYYFHVTVPPLMAFSGREIYYNQSLGSLLSRLLPHALAGELTLWISLLLIIVGLWIIWLKKIKLVPALVFFIPIFLMVEPLAWQHHFVFLLPVYIYIFFHFRNDTRRLALMALSYILVAVNIKNPAMVAQMPFAGIVLSHVFVGNAIVLGLVGSML